MLFLTIRVTQIINFSRIQQKSNIIIIETVSAGSISKNYENFNINIIITNENMFELLKIIGKIIYYSPLIILGYKTLPDLIHSFGIFYVKLSQILTTRSDILSTALIRRLEPLQDHVPVSKSVSSEGLRASGSISLIYDLPDSKIRKMKRPNIEQEITKGSLFLTQMFQSRLGLFLSRKSGFIHNASELVNLIQVQLPQHLNFEQEVENQKLMATLFGNQIHIPKIYSCTLNEIIMEKIDGVPLAEANNKEAVITNLLNAVFDMLFIHRLIHGDFHEGNILVDSDGKIALLDFAVILKISDDNFQHLRNFFFCCISKDYCSLCQHITLKQKPANTTKFQLDMKNLFTSHEFNDLYHFLNRIIQICLNNQVSLEHSLLYPMTFMIQVEGIAKKYSKLNFTSIMYKRLNDLFKIFPS